jgi:hypothetical protein
MIVARSVFTPSLVLSTGRKVVVTPPNLSSRSLSRRTFFWGGNQHQRPGSSNISSWSRRSFTSTTISPSRDPGLEVTSVISDPKEVEGPRGVPSRAEQIRRLQSPTINEDGVFDILVIGGGVTGAGIAMDAAQRGLQTACIERGDFSSETSSRSTKLIWVRLVYARNSWFPSAPFWLLTQLLSLLHRLVSSTWPQPRPFCCLRKSFLIPLGPSQTLFRK